MDRICAIESDSWVRRYKEAEMCTLHENGSGSIDSCSPSSNICYFQSDMSKKKVVRKLPFSLV